MSSVLIAVILTALPPLSGPYTKMRASEYLEGVRH